MIREPSRTVMLASLLFKSAINRREQRLWQRAPYALAFMQAKTTQQSNYTQPTKHNIQVVTLVISMD